MAIIKSFSPLQNLSEYNVFINDFNSNSTYFRITLNLQKHLLVVKMDF